MTKMENILNCLQQNLIDIRIYDLDNCISSCLNEEESLEEKIKVAIEAAFSDLNQDVHGSKLKEHFVQWIQENRANPNLLNNLIDRVDKEYKDVTENKTRELISKREQAKAEKDNSYNNVDANADELKKKNISLEASASENEQESKKTNEAMYLMVEDLTITRIKGEQLRDQVNETQKLVEELNKSLDEFLKDYQDKLAANQQEGFTLEALESIRGIFTKFFSFVKESSSTDHSNPPLNSGTKDKWNKLVELIVSEDCFAIKYIKKYFIERLKSDIEEAKDDFKKSLNDSQKQKNKRALNNAKLTFYRDMLGHLIEVTGQKQSALKAFTASKEQVKVDSLREDLSFINERFLHYFSKYRRSYSPDNLLLTPPTDLMVRKYYANLGYSKWNHIRKLWDLEEVKDWQLPLAIPAIMKKNGGEFLQWMEKYPHSASLMAADLVLTHSILKQDDVIEKIRKTLQTHTLTLNFLDALGFCGEEPLQSEQECKFKALADFIAQAPLLATVLAQLMSNTTLLNKIFGGVIGFLVNSTIQNLNRHMSSEMREITLFAVDILKGSDLQKILQNERNRRFVKLIGTFKQAIQRPEDTSGYLQEKWKMWWETIQRSTGQENIARLFVQIVIPVVGAMAAVAYLVSGVVGTYFSVWKGLSLAISVSGISLYFSHYFYRLLNSRYKETYEAVEGEVKNKKDEDKDEAKLKNFVNDEVSNLQNFDQIPKIPERFQEYKIEAEDLPMIEKLETHMERLLNCQLDEYIQKGKKESIKLYLKVFNEVFVMKDIKQMMEILVCSIELKPGSLAKTDFPSSVHVDEPFLEDLQKDLKVLLNRKESDFLNHVNDSVFLLSRNLINHWLKEKFLSYWEKSVLDKQSNAYLIKEKYQNLNSEMKNKLADIEKKFADKGRKQQYPDLFQQVVS